MGVYKRVKSKEESNFNPKDEKGKIESLADQNIRDILDIAKSRAILNGQISHMEANLINNILAVDFIDPYTLQGRIVDDEKKRVVNVKIHSKKESRKELTASGFDHLEGTVDGKETSKEEIRKIVDKYFTLMQKLDKLYYEIYREKNKNIDTSV